MFIIEADSVLCDVRDKTEENLTSLEKAFEYR